MSEPRLIEWYGWIPDLPDKRDFAYSAPGAVVGDLPPKVDLRPACPPVFSQNELGSCTANAIGAAHMFNQMKQGSKVMTPSRLFIYYGEREMEGTVGVDSGAQIRDGIKVVAEKGTCDETEWPYVIPKFRDRPTDECYRLALDHQAVMYSRIAQDLNQMKGCLASGFPFVFGFTVYNNFETQEVAKTGVLGMPGKGERALGGHAVMCVGYDAPANSFVVQNSWGTDWGQAGFFTIPFSYLLDSDLAADFWTIRMVEA